MPGTQTAGCLWKEEWEVLGGQDSLIPQTSSPLGRDIAARGRWSWGESQSGVL